MNWTPYTSFGLLGLCWAALKARKRQRQTSFLVMGKNWNFEEISPQDIRGHLHKLRVELTKALDHVAHLHERNEELRAENKRLKSELLAK